jgi:hydroxyacylglutathione hydrolase
VVDTRPADQFAREHVRGTISIPFNRSFTTWAGWLLPYERSFALLVDESDPRQVAGIVRDLAMIGLDDVAGWYDAGALAASRAAGGELQDVPTISSEELAPRLARGDVTVVDVRGRSEWEAGHLPGVENIPVGYLDEHLDELPRDGGLVLQCQTGARSSIAASLLQARGFTNVMNLDGGFAAWRDAGYPVVREDEDAVAPAGSGARERGR